MSCDILISVNKLLIKNDVAFSFILSNSSAVEMIVYNSEFTECFQIALRRLISLYYLFLIILRSEWNLFEFNDDFWDDWEIRYCLINFYFYISAVFWLFKLRILDIYYDTDIERRVKRW